MKIIISESRVGKLVAEYIGMVYGELNQVYFEDRDNYEWYREGEDIEETYPLFELSTNGTLFIPETLEKSIGDYFAFEYRREITDVVMDAFKYMYGIRPERVNIYFD